VRYIGRPKISPTGPVWSVRCHSSSTLRLRPTPPLFLRPAFTSSPLSWACSARSCRVENVTGFVRQGGAPTVALKILNVDDSASSHCLRQLTGHLPTTRKYYNRRVHIQQTYVGLMSTGREVLRAVTRAPPERSSYTARITSSVRNEVVLGVAMSDHIAGLNSLPELMEPVHHSLAVAGFYRE
jgi:hypothetical protein